MGFLDKIFCRRKPEDRQEKDLTKIQQYLDTIKIPAILLEKSDSRNFSKIGGLPILPKSIDWPRWKDKPMSFLCQIDLAAIPKVASFPICPDTGFLNIFYDQDQSTWGFDPKDRGSWKVLYNEQIIDAAEVNPPKELEQNIVFKEKFIEFSKVLTYPDLDDERIRKLNLSNSQTRKYFELCESSFGDLPRHQLFGYPSPVQGNNMDLECQLVTNDIYCGDPSGYQDSRGKYLEKGRENWILLLQLDTDDDTGMMWGDVGRLFFWIKIEDLKNANFNDVWMILQCS